MHLKSFLKQIQEVSVALGLHFFIGDEAQSRTVDAVAHAIGGLRIAGEHVAEMGTISEAGSFHTTGNKKIRLTDKREEDHPCRIV